MDYPTFEFEFIKIKEYLKSLKDNQEKLIYLKFIRKELTKVIFAFTVTEFKGVNLLGDDIEDQKLRIKIINKRESCPELDRMSDELIKELDKEKINRNKDILPLSMRSNMNVEVFKFQIDRELERFKQTLQHIEGELAYFDFLKEVKNEADSQEQRKQFNEIQSNKVSIIGNKIDVVRIFEAMRKAKITSVKQGEMKKYGNIFTDEYFVDKYYAERRRLEKDQSSSNSAEIIEFIKILCESSLKGKDPEIEQIITHLEHLQKKY